ncbi:MAG: hypothetical protein HFH15_15655 [Ruminococcus sp.]|nr:hypothetical protein [Ruminococcus sp.]
MRSKLIIDGNAVYELDEDCMLKKSREELRDMKRDFEEQEDVGKEEAE